MTYWRETTSIEAQNDFETLVDTVIPYASHTLGKHGELYPFGAAIGESGEAGIRAAMPDADRPDSESVLRMLRESARAEAGELRSVGFVSDVRTTTGDAIRIEVEHREGAAITMVVPYTRSRWKKQITTGDMFVLDNTATIWS